MAKLNTYGLKMYGLKKAAAATKNLRGPYDVEQCYIFYYPISGNVVALLRDNSFSGICADNGPAVYYCGRISYPATAQEIADIVAKRILYLAEIANNQ